MFRFANPQYLVLLIILPVLLFLYIWSTLRKVKNIRQLGSKEIIKLLMPELSPKRERLKFWILLIALSVLIVVIARPQFGSKLETVRNQGMEIMVCLDVSNSMLAEDVSPNRLEKAKQILSKMIDRFDHDKVGLIVFAGEAYTQLPITTDYLSAKMFLSSIDPSLVPDQGTAIGAAITLANRSFSPDNSADKTIILITDGENHEKGTSEAVAAAVSKNITVNVIGMGLEKGGPIPMPGTNEYLKDNEGNMVITKLNEDMCKEIAATGKGIYVRADNTNTALKVLQTELSKMKKSEIESKVYSEYDEQFQVFAWVALLLLFFELIILQRKSRRFKHVKLFNREGQDEN